MEQNNENILSEETIGFIKKCYIHLNQARQGVWAFADLAEIVWNPKIQKKNKELYFSIIHDAIAYEIIKYEEILEMSELKNDFLAFYSKFVSKINTSHEYTNFLEDRITTLENRFGLVWKEQEEQLLKIVSEDEIILGVGKFLINKDYIFDGESKDKKKKFIKNKDGKQFTLTRKRGDSFLYFCKELNQLFLLYSVQSKINVYSFVENHYTKYYPILVKKGENFGFGEVRDNLLIEGDNYFALQLLQFTHRGKIDVIYIDPPYNTGVRDFKYNDSWVGKDDGDRHSKWLSFIEKRLLLANNLLAKNGVIFISIDENEQSHLKLICNKIFNESNVEEIIWNTEAEGKSGDLKQVKRLKHMHEYIIVCYKNKESTVFNKVKEAMLNPKFQTSNLAKNIANKKNDSERIFEIKSPDGKSWIDEWKFSKAQIDELISKNMLYFGKDGSNKPRVIIETGENRQIYQNTILNKGSTTQGKKDLLNIVKTDLFDFPKPINLITTLISLINNKDSIILDFFAGSGTTGQAIIKLNKEDGGNRKYILCTNNEDRICEDVTYSRLERVNNPTKFNLNIDKLEHGLEYLQIKHISDLDLESADDIGNFEYVKHVNNVKFGATKIIQENDYLYITDTYSVFKKSNKNKQKEYCEFFEQSIKENITNLVFVSSDRTEYDYFRKVISDYISTLEEHPLFEKIKYYQMSKNYMDNMLSIINGEEEIDVEKHMVDEQNQENGE